MIGERLALMGWLRACWLVQTFCQTFGLFGIDLEPELLDGNDGVWNQSRPLIFNRPITNRFLT